MINRDVAKLMAKLWFDESAARAVLLQIGFPQNAMPGWDRPDAFWTSVVLMMEQGMGDEGAIAQLVAEAHAMYPGNAEAAEMHERISGKPEPKKKPGPDDEEEEEPVAEGPCHTLTLIGADLPDEFMNVVSQQLGSAGVELLYVSRQQCSVAISDPGLQGDLLQTQVQEIMDTYAPGAQVIYEKYQFRPYLYASLTVDGPDGSPYLFESVPATLTPGDIAAAIVAQSSALSPAQGGPVSTVVDAVTTAGPERLDPEKTLHENKVGDKGKLRVGTKVVAGNISPQLRMEAQLRMRAQIRRYAFGHPTFEIVGYDDEDLPNRLTFEFEGPGLAPPPNLAEFLAGTENLRLHEFRALPWEQLVPVRTDFHRFTMHLSAMFPVIAPYVVWDTPVFHPNIWRAMDIGVRPGTVCLGPLMEGYRPDLDFGYLCQLLVDIGTYRNYDVVDASTYPDPPAALWARTPAGQAIIESIGGPPMRLTTERDGERRVTPPLWLSLLADRTAGEAP